jgi:predicted peroxiredoxin
MGERRSVVFLSHGDETSLRLAGSCALAAAAMGSRVDVFLFGDAVPAAVSAHGEPADEPGALLHQARAAGCRLIACSASVVAGKVDLQAAERALDAVVGWPTVLAWSEGVTERFSF